MEKLFLFLSLALVIGLYIYQNPHELFTKQTTYYMYYKEASCTGECAVVKKHRDKESCVQTAISLYEDRKMNPTANYSNDTAGCYSFCPLTIDRVAFDDELCSRRELIDLSRY